MPFSLVWDTEAAKTYNEIRKKAKKSFENRENEGFERRRDIHAGQKEYLVPEKQSEASEFGDTRVFRSNQSIQPKTKSL